ncbi:MAG: hypothetical protein HXX17_12200 [Geobacteraceae bacterium]|nr:hypothetical protein [Geobacteraceae bacterium]
MKTRLAIFLILSLLSLAACNSANIGAQQLETALFEEKQNNREHATRLYEEIVSKYPGSPNAKIAQEHLDKLKAGK